MSGHGRGRLTWSWAGAGKSRSRAPATLAGRPQGAWEQGVGCGPAIGHSFAGQGGGPSTQEPVVLTSWCRELDPSPREPSASTTIVGLCRLIGPAKGAITGPLYQLACPLISFDHSFLQAHSLWEEGKG